MFKLTSKYNLKLHREPTGQINKDNIKTPLCSTFAPLAVMQNSSFVFVIKTKLRTAFVLYFNGLTIHYI